MKKLFLLPIFILFFSLVGVAEAEVTTPLYTIDYKPQILFGDSAVVAGYQGLQNYVADYVGGYLHLAFSITHGLQSYASYPPLLFVFPDDPTVSNTSRLYNGLFRTLGYFDPTDVYFFDIQFSSDGYRQIVTEGTSTIPFSDNTVAISNMNGDTFIALANDYPLNDPPFPYSMSFQPMRLVATSPSKILSFDISTTTHTATIHSHISTNDTGATLHFNISTPAGTQVYTASPITATTIGDLSYTFTFPALTDPATTKPQDFLFHADITTNSGATRVVEKTLTISSPIDNYPGYANFSGETSQPTGNSLEHLVQTLGTGLSGALTQIDVKTQNQGGFYGDHPSIILYQCDDETYGSPTMTGYGNCVIVYRGASNDQSHIIPATQSFYIDPPITFDPSKYYFFEAIGDNQIFALLNYYGSATDTVDGACYQYSSQSAYLPCANVADLYFYLRGVTKSAIPPTPTCVTDCFSNVLFLPGLEASRLYVQKTVLGLPVEDQLWEPNVPSDVNDLFLDQNGNSIKSGIYTKDIVDSTNILPIIYSQNIYKDLITKLNNLVSTWKINNWKSYAYDWRQGIDDLVQNGTKYNNNQTISLMGTLQSLINTSKTGKVTIIAHSNGGLLAKALIKKLEDDKSAGKNNLIDHIDMLIMVASPQLGTPDTLSAILHGYDQEILNGFLMSEQQARNLGQNMPSAYGLLPSKKYFDQSGIFSVATFASTSAQMYQTTYNSYINNYQKEHNFVLGQEGRTQPAGSDLISPIKGNSTLLTQAESLHDSIDNMTIPSSIKVIDIAGWGKSTLTGVIYTGTDIQPIYNIRGDETVFMPSALYGQGTKYWLDLSNSTLGHKDIMEDPQLLNFISSVIQQQPLTFSVVTNAEPAQTGNRLHLSVHSPVTIGTTDKNGNFTGKICDNNGCYVQENIPGSTYQEFGEGKYVTLAEGKLQKVNIQGTDTGSFTFDFQKVAPNGTTQTQSFIDIPVTTQTTAEITVNQKTGAPQLALDVTGDGKTDFTLTPSATFDPVIFLQVMRATVNSFDMNKITKTLLLLRIDDTIKAIQKGKINKAKLDVKQFEKSLTTRSKIMTIFEKMKWFQKITKPKMMTQDEIQTLLTMLNQLLNNLNQ